MSTTKSKRFSPSICIMQVALLFIVNNVFAAQADDSAWTLVSEKGSQDKTPATNSVSDSQWIRPSKYQRAVLDVSRFGQQIDAAVRAEAAVVVSIPKPDGSLERFRVTPAGDMHPDLQLWFAGQGMPMQTYKGVSLDRPGNTIRMDFGGPGGLHASVYSAGKSYFVDPLFKNDKENYASYYRHDFRSSDEPWSCQVHEKPVDQALPAEFRPADGAEVSTDSTGGDMRTFRLAVAATGEYTSFHGGAVGAQAAIVTSVSRVNQIYERDLSVHMELIGNNSLLVYTNSATDPYTNNNGGAMLSQNQDNIDSVIGSANYDIGHVFSTGGGGVAYLAVICNSEYKAGGVTGLGAPIGDPFDIDFVAHEMGHQWGGSHTFNSSTSSCGGNRSASSAYEPGSGSTIQAYAGICAADNLQSNSDAYFHARSLDQMLEHAATGQVTACAATVAVNPLAPEVEAGEDYMIPANTAFELTAAPLSPPEPDELLTYSWAQFDLGPSTSLADGDTGSGPIIRSEHPVESAARMIPSLSSLQSGSSPPGYILPTTNRDLNFRVTIRDNNPAGGRTNEDFMNIQVVNTGSAFAITYPNTSATIEGEQTILWEPAGTGAEPINAENVDILLSRDNGETWPHTLAANTPNDGSELVTIPKILTQEARIRIQPVDNIFFDISDDAFAIGAESTCASPGLFIDTGFVQSSINLTNTDLITGLQVSTDISHTWVGDLTLSLEHIDTGTTVLLMDQPGVPASANGCSYDDVEVLFDDASLIAVETECSTTPPAIGGVVHPEQDLVLFDGEAYTGEWQLTVTDNVDQDTGFLNEWCLLIEQASSTTIAVSTQQIDFGIIDPDLGPSAEQPLGIQSTGLFALEIIDISLSGPDAALFAIVSDSGEYFLDPGLTRNLGVVFDPDSEGPKSATLTITSDDADNPVTVIQLMGSGGGDNPEIFKDSFEGNG